MTGTSENKSHDDEIDLRELFVSLWRGKWIIMLSIVCAIALASVYLRNADRKYTVKQVFSPIATENSGPNLSGLGGLASLAGVALPSSSSSDFLTFKFLLKSEEVAAVLIQDKNLVQAIFAGEWDAEQERFKKPPDGPLAPVKKVIKNALLGSEDLPYVPPNAQRLADWMIKAFSSSEDRDTGFLTISSETQNPELMMQVIKAATITTDDLLKTRYIESAEQTVAFYQTQLQKARAREHREALAKLIAGEDQKLMLASKGSYFVAEPLSEATVSLRPTSPKGSLVLALSIVLGGFFGSALVLIRKAIGS